MLRAAYHVGRAVACNRLGRVTYPSLAHLFVTWRCNLRCQTCNVWKEDLYPELPTDQMERVLDQLTFLDIIKLTGGEPFLREDIVHLVEVIQRRIRPAFLHVVSNGTVTERMQEMVEKCASASLHIRLSIEGTDDTHNRLRGRAWAFERTWKCLEMLVALRRRKRFHLGVNYHLCEATLDDLPKVLEYCSKHNVDLVPGLAVFPFLEDKFEEKKQGPIVRDADAFLARYREVWRQQAGLSPLARWLVRRQGVRAVEDVLRATEPSRFGCRELRNLMYILPNGNLVTCGLKHKPIGNLARQRFEDIWLGPDIERFRQDVDACGGCWQSSIKMASRLYNGDWR